MDNPEIKKKRIPKPENAPSKTFMNSTTFL